MLSTHNLNYSYPNGGAALKNINLNLSNGQVIGLIGANGSGKSTLFMNLLGVLKPTQGQVLFNDKPLKYDKSYLRELRQHVSMVFQDPDQQIFYTDIKSDIAFSLRNLGLEENLIQQRIEQALTLVDAQSFQQHPVQYLSYGQKKRVAIAGALVMQADCVLLDEPTAGLDPCGRESMIDIISRIAAENRHIVISSHDIDLIYQVCDYLYVLKQGQILTHGVTDEVFLQSDMIREAGLVQPWLVKIHIQLGFPLYKTEEKLFAQFDLNHPQKQ